MLFIYTSEVCQSRINEILIQVYAYAGFPRSLQGIQTFMTVVDDRKSKGIKDIVGSNISPISNDSSKYERGKAILAILTGVKESGQKKGYAAFAPTIEIFLKEHLFADIFEREILTYKERELVTVSVLSALGNVEPMLRSHLNICLNVGISTTELVEFVNVIGTTTGKKDAKVVRKIMNEILTSKQ